MLSTEDTTMLRKVIRETLAECGLITPYMTRQEAITQVGRIRYDRAVRSGIISRRKSRGRNAKVEIDRADFAEMLHKGAI